VTVADSRRSCDVIGLLQMTMCGCCWTVRSTQSGSRTSTPCSMTPRSWRWPTEIAFRWRRTARSCLKCTTSTTRLLLRSLAMEWCSSALLLLIGDHYFRYFFTRQNITVCLLL